MLTETVLLGNVAIQAHGKKLLWNAPNLKITNVPEANPYLRREYRSGWSLKGPSSRCAKLRGPRNSVR